MAVKSIITDTNFEWFQMCVYLKNNEMIQNITFIKQQYHVLSFEKSVLNCIFCLH